MNVRNCISLVFICFGFVFAQFGFAATSFVERLKSIESLSGEFTQTIVDADGQEVSEATEGEFSLLRPGKFYWKTKPPFEQLVVGNDAGLVVFDPDLEQVTIYGPESFLNTPAAVLSGDLLDIDEKYSITAKKDSKNDSYVLRERSDSNRSFDTLTFVFKKNKLLSLSLLDQLGQTTDIQFSSLKQNKEIDEGLFQFVPPEGADVIVNP